jgi:hypothetical protein
MDDFTAAEAEAIGLELSVHNWVSPEGVAPFRQFLASRIADEKAEVRRRRIRGERGDLFAEVRRLTWWCSVIDVTAAHKPGARRGRPSMYRI